MNRTITTRATVRRVATNILAIFLTLTGSLAQADLVPQRMNVRDTDTGLEWRKYSALASQGAYNDALGKYDAGSTYRLPTAAEVDNLLGKLFPGFIANDASGRCSLGPNAELLAQAQKFSSLFGAKLDGSNTRYNAMYQDSAGQLRALYVDVSPYSNYGTKVCLTGLSASYDQYRTSAPLSQYPDLLVMVVRDAIDVKVPVVTLYNYVHPNDIGLKVPEFYSNPYEAYDTDPNDAKWTPRYFGTDYAGIPIFSVFGLYGNPADFAAGKSAPWVRLRSIDFKPVPEAGAVCSAPTDTLLGNGLCRRNFVGNYYPWHLTAASAAVPGSIIYNQIYSDQYSGATVDNVVVEQVWETMTVDYAPSTPDNTIRPKNPGWSIYIAIKNTSVAAGDAYDLNPAYVDPASLKLGTKMAPVLNYQVGDIDGDGDQDYVYQFNTGATGVSCLDTRITLAGKTYWGIPVAGHDTVVPVGCTETVLMDVDPFNATNTIRPNDNYNATVAILGMRTTAGDAVNLYPGTTGADGVNNTSLKFGPAQTPLVGTPVLTDIDGDSYQDMLVNFNVFAAGIACGDTQVELQGKKNSGIPIMAIDNIVTTDCETGGCHP